MPISSSTSNPSPNGWETAAPYARAFTAAATAVVPAYPDLYAKSMQQLRDPILMTFWEALKDNVRQLREPMPLNYFETVKGALKIAPTAGVIISSQMAIQQSLEARGLSKEKSSIAVGFLSAPALAVFNGQAAGQGVWKPFRNLFTMNGFKQAGAIAGQETCFVYSVAAAEPASEWAKGVFGENKVVEYTAAFFTGAAGSLGGHGFNTALTRWQNNKPVAFDFSLANGALRKARAIGIFAIVYKFMKNQLNPQEKQDEISK